MSAANGDNRRIGAHGGENPRQADQRQAEAGASGRRGGRWRRCRARHVRRPAWIERRRTGSNRHDGGAAADLELIASGRTLDFTVRDDLAAICRFVAAAAAQGAIGIGAGVDYMGPTRLHVGFGNGPQDTTKVVWGAGGAPANAPA